MKRWIYRNIIRPLFLEYILPRTFKSEIWVLRQFVDTKMLKGYIKSDMGEHLATDIAKEMIRTKMIKITKDIDVIGAQTIYKVKAELKAYKP